MRTDRPTPAVVKFGGASFIELADYRRVAAYLSRRADDSAGMVVVVSGMSGTTSRLLEAALAIDPNLQPQVQDQVLATAEMVSASFLRAALNAQGWRAIDLWAPQIGIRSDDIATRAKIVFVDPQPVLDALAEHRLVVVAGGQAVRADERITMLGRNSSDLTAVALAAALGAESCEIFSDVPGVYTADPYLVPSAKLLPELSYEQCAAMSASGAKVLHWGSVAAAQEYDVTIICRALEMRDLPGEPTATTGSTVGTGRGDTVVVGDRRVQLYRLSTPTASATQDDHIADDRVLAAVRAAGLVVLPVTLGNDTVLAFAGTQTGVAHALAEAGVKAEPVEGFGLVSVVTPDGLARRQLVALDEVDATVRQLHTQVHGTSADSVGGQVPAFAAKRRSAHSSLLSGVPMPASAR